MKLEGFFPKGRWFDTSHLNSGSRIKLSKIIWRSPLEELVVLRTNVRNSLLKFEFGKLALGYTHTFMYTSFHS